MNHLEYLAGYGTSGDFGRFRAARPLECQRGERVVVQSHRGLELAQVLRPASPRHAQFLPNTSVGRLLRLASVEDERTARQMRERGQHLFARARERVTELGLPLEVLDTEVLLDGQHGVIHHLRWDDCDIRPLVSSLSREFDLHVILADLTRGRASAEPEHEEDEEHGCGSCSSGSCGSGGCGSGGCGSCGSAKPEEVRAHFAELREQMERRVPLL